MKESMKESTSLPKTIRNTVWRIYHDQSICGLCFCCGIEEISIGNFECGHVISRKDGGSDSILNLRPICSLCNKSMGTTNMDEFMKKYGYQEDLILFFKDKKNNINNIVNYNQKKETKFHPTRISNMGKTNIWLVEIKKNKINVNYKLFIPFIKKIIKL